LRKVLLENPDLQKIIHSCDNLTFILAHEECLTTRQAMSLKLRHAHVHGKRHTYKSIGEIIKYGDSRPIDRAISGNRAWQIYIKAILKIYDNLTPWFYVFDESLLI
jgi:hypothetical protein